MKLFRNIHITWLMSFFLLFSLQNATAQDVQVISQTESSTQATYKVKFNGKRAEVTLRKERGKISIRLKNQNGDVLGKGYIENDGNGNPLYTIDSAKPGTLAFWRFALQHFTPDGNGVSLLPRQKAYLKCKDRCKDLVTSHPGWQVLTVSGGSQSLSVVQLKTVKKAFEAYTKCMWKCMREARKRYQNQN